MSFFENLFVLEMANNHWGSVERAKAIIDNFLPIIKKHNVKATFKLQIRDVDNFVHKDYRKSELRYPKKTIDTKLSDKQFFEICEYIRSFNLPVSATCFDERSVDFANNGLEIDMFKVASSDKKDSNILGKVYNTGKPVSLSMAGHEYEEIWSLLYFHFKRGVEYAINHCVANYPTKKENLNLGLINELKEYKIFRDFTIGFSSHEFEDWNDSIIMAYGMGARTFERHIDCSVDGREVSPYCSTPENFEVWIQAFQKAKTIFGKNLQEVRGTESYKKQIEYLHSLKRGVFLKRSIEAGENITYNDLYFAIPNLEGQLVSDQIKENFLMISTKNYKKDEPLI